MCGRLHNIGMRTTLGLLASALVLHASTPRALAGSPPNETAKQPDTLRLYVGTYTSAASKGIYTLEMDVATGRLGPAKLAAETANPSFLALHPNGKFMYAVGELGDFQGRKSGAVSAFAITPQNGDLKLLNQQPSGGYGPCHVVIHPDSQHVLVANYSSGSAAVLPIRLDGQLGEPTAVVQHEGTGPDPQRQQGPHAHAVQLDQAGRFAFVADLGLDKILVYRFGRDTGTITPNEPPAAKLAPGAGPRHLAFHPNGRLAYVINELDSTVTAFAYHAESGTLQNLHSLSTLPTGFAEPNTTAEIRVHPTGRFLYGSNRGHDSIAAFTVEPQTGRLTAIGHQSSGGRTPRNFNIDPTGRWLVAANQASDTLVVLKIDPATGSLSPTGIIANVPTPVCIAFAAPPTH